MYILLILITHKVIGIDVHFFSLYKTLLEITQAMMVVMDITMALVLIIKAVVEETLVR